MGNSETRPDSSLIEHLKLIEGVIDRLARSSFAIKATSSAVAVALAAIIITQDTPIAGIGVFPLAVLWLLDSYYLSRERAYRALYELIRITRPERDDPMYFSLSVNRTKDGIFRATLSPALLLFHPPLIVTALLLIGASALT